MTKKLRQALANKQEELAKTTEALSQARRDFNTCRASYADARIDYDYLDASAAWKDLGKIKDRIKRLERKRRKHEGDVARLKAMIRQPSDLEIA